MEAKALHQLKIYRWIHTGNVVTLSIQSCDKYGNAIVHLNSSQLLSMHTPMIRKPIDKR